MILAVIQWGLCRLTRRVIICTFRSLIYTIRWERLNTWPAYIKIYTDIWPLFLCGHLATGNLSESDTLCIFTHLWLISSVMLSVKVVNMRSLSAGPSLRKESNTALAQGMPPSYLQVRPYWATICPQKTPCDILVSTWNGFSPEAICWDHFRTCVSWGR